MDCVYIFEIYKEISLKMLPRRTGYHIGTICLSGVRYELIFSQILHFPLFSTKVDALDRSSIDIEKSPLPEDGYKRLFPLILVCVKFSKIKYFKKKFCFVSEQLGLQKEVRAGTAKYAEFEG